MGDRGHEATDRIGILFIERAMKADTGIVDEPRRRSRRSGNAFPRMMRGAGVVIPGIAAKILAVAGELPPRRVALEINRLLLRPPSRLG